MSDDATEASLEDFVNRVATLVVSNHGWKGTASELLLVTGCTAFSTNYITKLLRMSRSRLEIKGITFQSGKTNGKRFIRFQMTGNAPLPNKKEHTVLSFPTLDQGEKKTE